MAIDIIARGLIASVRQEGAGLRQGYYYEGEFYEDAELSKPFPKTKGYIYADVSDGSENVVQYFYDGESFQKIEGGSEFPDIIDGNSW